MSLSDKPLVAILDGSLDVTGALNAARREARLLGDWARFMLILPQGSRIRSTDLPEFAEVLYLPFPKLKRNAWAMAAYAPSLVRSARRLARELRDRGCAALQVNDFYLAHGVLMRTFGFDGRIVTWVRMDPSAYGSLLGRALLGLARRRSTHVVAVSRTIAALLPPEGGACIVYDPTPNVVRRLAVPSASRFVLIGNYISGKGQDLAIRAFAQIAGSFPAAELAFHGSDMGRPTNRAYRDQLEALAQDLGVGARVAFGQFLADPGEAIRPALSALCLSSRESFSLVTQEASALGVPVIATRCGGPEEIVEDGQTGWLVPVGDVDAIAAAMSRALEDPARAAAMGAAGAALVRERFAADRFRQQVSELLDL